MSERIKRLAAELRQDEAAIVVSDVNRYYLTGFKSSCGAVVVTQNNAYLFVDFRYSEAAAKKAVGCEVIEFKNMNESIQTVLRANGIKKAMIEYENIAFATALRLIGYLEEINVEVNRDDRLETLLNMHRMVKTEEEIACIAKAQEITETAYNHVLTLIKEGITESKIAFELEMSMRKNGAEGVSFDLITICGQKTSLPHGEPDDTVVKKGDFITMDIGAVYNGYHSDMTRTVVLGEPSEEQRKIYDIVLKAQLAGLAAVKAGVNSCDVDKASRDVIASNGYGKYFGHSTGHGVGLEIHESPAVSVRNGTVLKPGMVITVEPGIYLPDKFGVRIEDMILVTEDGYRNFASVPKELTVI